MMIGEIIREICLKSALNHHDAATRKKRVMDLYERGILHAAEVENLLSRNGLSHF